MSTHEKDEDCTVDVATDCCQECGVYHGEPCDICGRRGYHEVWCEDVEPITAREIVTSRWQMIDTEEIEQENAIWPWLADDSMADETEGY
jgi:hypothetical protein